MLLQMPDIHFLFTFYYVGFSQHFKDQMPRKNEFDILIAVLHISGLLFCLELKIKSRIIKKLMTLQSI